jgi:GNAT superfamily N-acetyltransferase
VTLEAHRRLGLGKLIMAHTLDFAWQQGCYKAMLLTGSKRESTHAFYRSNGAYSMIYAGLRGSGWNSVSEVQTGLAVAKPESQ